MIDESRKDTFLLIGVTVITSIIGLIILIVFGSPSPYTEGTIPSSPTNVWGITFIFVLFFAIMILTYKLIKLDTEGDSNEHN